MNLFLSNKYKQILEKDNRVHVLKSQSNHQSKGISKDERIKDKNSYNKCLISKTQKRWIQFLPLRLSDKITVHRWMLKCTEASSLLLNLWNDALTYSVQSGERRRTPRWCQIQLVNNNTDSSKKSNPVISIPCIQIAPFCLCLSVTSLIICKQFVQLCK